MAITYVDTDMVPSIGVLTSVDSLEAFDRQDELSDRISDFYDRKYNTSFFGSNDDIYYESYSRNVDRYSRRMERTMYSLRDTLVDMSEEDVIRPCVTERSFRRLPPSMYDAILSHKPLFRLFRQRRVQGWGDITPEQIQPLRREYDLMCEYNGRLVHRKHNQEHTEGEYESKLTYTWTGDVGYMTAQQILDIKATRHYVDHILENTDLDPTCLDMERG